MSKEKTYKPGAIVPASGQYGKLGPRGGKRDGEATCTIGEHFPPTQNPGETYYLIDKTKHVSKN